MSRQPAKKGGKAGNQQTRVLNENDEAIRAQRLALRDKDAEIKQASAQLDAALEGGDDWQAQQDARDLERLRRERLSMSAQLDRLSESQFGYRDFLGEIETQKRIQTMNEQKDRLVTKTDMVGLYQSGVKAEGHDLGLAELRQVTSPSEERQTQKSQAVDGLLAEARARIQARTATTTTSPAPVVTAPPVRQTANNTNGGGGGGGGKYSRADELLDFL